MICYIITVEKKKGKNSFFVPNQLRIQSVEVWESKVGSKPELNVMSCHLIPLSKA